MILSPRTQLSRVKSDISLKNEIQLIDRPSSIHHMSLDPVGGDTSCTESGMTYHTKDICIRVRLRRHPLNHMHISHHEFELCGV